MTYHYTGIPCGVVKVNPQITNNHEDVECLRCIASLNKAKQWKDKNKDEFKTCKNCNQERKSEGFKDDNCYYCSYVKNKGSGKKKNSDVFKKRKCMNCSKEFETAKDYRMCNPCKNNEYWKDNENEYSISN